MLLLVLAPSCCPKPPPPTTVKVPVVVKPPSCIELVGDAPEPPAADTAPAPVVDIAAAEALVFRLRGDGDQAADVPSLALVLLAALHRIRDLEDPAWRAYDVEHEAWTAKVIRTCGGRR